MNSASDGRLSAESRLRLCTFFKSLLLLQPQMFCFALVTRKLSLSFVINKTSEDFCTADELQLHVQASKGIWMTLKTYDAEIYDRPGDCSTFPMTTSGVDTLERWEARQEWRMGPSRRCGKETCGYRFSQAGQTSDVCEIVPKMSCQNQPARPNCRTDKAYIPASDWVEC